MRTTLLLLLTMVCPLFARAQTAGAPPKTDSPRLIEESRPKVSQAELEKGFQDLLTNARFKGRWSLVEGDKLGEEHQDQYSITSVRKVEGDTWAVYARIQYGERDVTVPVPVQVKWAGDTPVISLTDAKIPGLGTYSARVVVYGETYAGTWSAPDHRGLMHGVITRGEPQP